MHQHPNATRACGRVAISVSLFLSLICLAGCGSGGGDGPVIAKTEGTYKIGYFIDSPVEGLQYTSITWYGLTNAQGGYYYQDGEEITFSIGSVILGRTTAKGIITPVDLDQANPTTSSTTVINISRLLITLDDDQNPDNGITITDEVRNALTGISIDLSDPDIDNSAGIQEMFNRLNEMGIYPEEVTELVSAEVAQSHLQNSLDEIEAEELAAEEALENLSLQARMNLPLSSVIMLEGQSLNLQGSVIGGKAPYTYAWSINNDKPFSLQQNPGTYPFKSKGSYLLSFTAKDSTGTTKTDTRLVSVYGVECDSGTFQRDSVPTPTILTPAPDSEFKSGDTVDFQALVYNGNVPLYCSWPMGSDSGYSFDPYSKSIVYISPRTYVITQSITFTTPGVYVFTVQVQDTGIDGNAPDQLVSSVRIIVK
jgi:hypothetical protein